MQSARPAAELAKNLMANVRAMLSADLTTETVQTVEHLVRLLPQWPRAPRGPRPARWRDGPARPHARTDTSSRRAPGAALDRGGRVRLGNERIGPCGPEQRPRGGRLRRAPGLRNRAAMQR